MQAPHDLETEQSLVAILLSGLAAAEEAADTYARITPEMLFSSKLRTVYAAARSLYESSLATPDADAVISKLLDAGDLEACGGRLFVFDLAENVSTGANLGYWAARIVDYSRRRDTMRAAHAAIASAANMETAIAQTIESLSQSISDVASGNDSTRPLSSVSVAERKNRDIRAALKSDSNGNRLATGIESVDEMIGGLCRSELAVLAGRPSMGKTSLALSILLNMRHIGAKSLFLSLEMSEQGITDKIIAMRTGIEADLIRCPRKMSESQRDMVQQSLFWLSECGIHFVFSPNVTPLDVRARARAVKARGGLDLVVVDYLQFMLPSERTNSRERDVATMSRALKAIALELDVNVLCLSQLNRALEQTADKRPMLSHLRESGAIEQDADVVMFVHRPSVYDKDGDPTYAEAIVAKNRNGPTCICPMNWTSKKTLFTSRRIGS